MAVGGSLVQHWYSRATLAKTVENGYILNLKRDGSFETDKPNTSSGGTYNIKGDNLILEYAGNIKPSQYTYRYSVSGDTLSLDPLSPTMCFEGCTSKLLRIK